MDNIEILFGGSWRKDETDFHKTVDNMVGDIERFAAASKGFKFSFGSNAEFKKQQQDSIKLIKELTAQVKLLQEQEKLRQAELINGIKAEKESANLKRSSAAANKAELAAMREKIRHMRELRKEQQEVERAQKKEEAQLKKNQSAYAQLNAEYRLAAHNAKELATTHGVESAAAKNAAASAMELHKRLLAIDETVGQSQRNVGNYKSHWNGLGTSIQQISRELPNFAQNIQTGFLAISNNLPMLADEIRRVKLENADLVKQGKPTVSVFKQIAASIFSWQTALIAVIALSVAYGKDFVNMLQGKTKAMLAAEKANKAYAESIKEIDKSTRASIAGETAHLNALNSIATNTTLSMTQRKNAALEMQKTYPATLGNLEMEAILENRVAGAIKATTAALIAKANAHGAQKKLEEGSDIMLDSQAKLYQGRVEQQKYINFLAKNTNVGIKQTDSVIKVLEKLKDLNDVEAYQAFTKELKKRAYAVNDLDTAYQRSVQNQKNLADQVTKFKIAEGFGGTDVPAGSIAEKEKAISDLKERERLAVVGSENQLRITKERIAAEKELDKILQRNQPKARVQRTTDLTNETLDVENTLTETLASIEQKKLERLARNNAAIADNEKESLDKRLTALYTYEDQKLAILDIGQAAELEVVDNNLAKIAEIEKKAVSKRTNEEKKLLLNKEVYEAQKLEILADYADKEQALTNEVALKTKKATEESMKMQLATILQGAQDIENQVKESEYRKLELLETAKANGLITQEQYEKQRKEIIANSNNDIAAGQRQYYLNEIDDLEKQGKLTKEVADKIRKEIAGLSTSKTGGGNQGGVFHGLVKSIFGDLSDEEVDKIVAAYTQAFNEIYSSIKTIISNKYAAEIQGLENEMDLLKTRYEQEVDYINSLSVTKEEREKRLADLKARNTLKELDQQRRINEVKRRQARAEKTANIAETVGKTAIAVMNALTVKPFYLGLALSVAAGIAGAAQIAAISSTPLPEYYKGTDSAKAGWAHVGERGAELVVGDDGAKLVKDHTIMNLKGGEKIFTADETNEMLKGGALKTLASSGKKVNEWTYMQAMVSETRKSRRDIVSAIERSKPNITIINQDSSYTQRINRH